MNTDRITRKNFDVIAVGLFYASVCTSLDNEAARKELESQAPCGTSKGWTVSDDKFFADGTPHPCQCPDCPSNRHILFAA